MTASAEALKEALISEVVERLRARLEAEHAEEIERFVRYYFSPASPDDLLQTPAEDLLGAVLSLWSFSRQRSVGTAKVRVYNPRVEDHGWQTGFTVVEIVNDDMPFLVDSVSAAVAQRGLDTHLLMHPVVRVERDEDGLRTRLLAADEEAEGCITESMMHLEVEREARPEALEELREMLESVLEDVRLAVDDWQPIRQKALDIIEELESNPPPVPAEEAQEVQAFLRWLADDHFTFLGYREADLVRQKGREYLRAVPETSLGVLRRARPSAAERPITLLTEAMSSFARREELLIVTKADGVATVHRPVHMDYIGIKRYNQAGEVVGERRILGLFTSVAYSLSPRTIPLLRQKVEHTVERAGFPPKGHDAKALVHILETFPRDELFQIGEEQLLYTALGILQLQERQRIALFLREDPFERFVSCLVYVPRDRYNTALRLRFGQILAQALDGEQSAVYSQIADSPLARVHLIIKTTPGKVPPFDRKQIEGRLVAAARTWSDRLQQVLISRFAEDRGLALHRRYGDAFPVAYREAFPPEVVSPDIENIEQMLAADGGEGGQPGRGGVELHLYRALEGQDHQVRLKLYHGGQPPVLSDVLPKLENLGFKVVSETPYAVRPAGVEEPVWIGDFDLQTADGSAIDLAAAKESLRQAFLDIWHGVVENDGFNRLVLAAGLTSRQVVVLRAYAKFLRQAGVTFSQRYMGDTLAANPQLSRLLVELFEASFDPSLTTEDGDRSAAESQLAEARAVEIEESIRELLDGVTNLDQDRMVRLFLNLVKSTLRTNFYQRGETGGPRPYLSFKLDSQQVTDLPKPRPRVEIFVYSPRFEAVHLRGGQVARGGLRWSDRREDFRTEILGLMKAQMVKNAVIVPVGAKGGFVLKQAPTEGGREAFLEEGKACYRMMIRGLLDLTDNLVDGAVVPPPAVVRRDPDDPYLVVAADKGTATFSDIANAISLEYGFWLGDAFASGGSAGYDHKKMGITARGAWESVKRHFRELGHDVQRQDFTVVGVGDMSGDVFGNGMLQSGHLRLLGAFNHLHIFVDPDPDAERSFAERERLFRLPSSTWDDYDRSVISTGGGIFPRSAKSLDLTPEIRQRFGIEEESVTPDELVRALLKAEADLLWFGGIGTYVKASHEHHSDTGDRNNDPVRVDASELRCRVIAEGANLGLTQEGRIEFALAGGRNNTDAIDNSAGVDCSDHEVNIKILLDGVVSGGDLTVKQRDLLLQEMTDEVAALVLRDNYLQTLAISVEEAQGPALVDLHLRMMRDLERAGRLDRALEHLPDDETLAERHAMEQGLTRPEIAVLLAYSKLFLYQELLESDLPDDALLVEDLVRYFPRPLREHHRGRIVNHRLRREIIATYTTNSMINRVGPTFITRLGEATGSSAVDIARAYTVTRDAYHLRDLWAQIEALDDKLVAELQMEMVLAVGRLLERTTLWFLRHSGGKAIDITATVRRYEAGVVALAEDLAAILPAEHVKLLEAEARTLQAKGAPQELARRIASLPLLSSACDIVRIAGEEQDVREVARIYFRLGARLGIDWLREASRKLRTKNRWQKDALEGIVEDFYSHQSLLTSQVLESGQGQARPVRSWMQRNRQSVGRLRQLVEELRAMNAVDISMLTVANQHLRALTIR